MHRRDQHVRYSLRRLISVATVSAIVIIGGGMLAAAYVHRTPVVSATPTPLPSEATPTPTVTASPSPSASPSPAPTAQPLLESQGLSAYNSRNYAEAITDFSKARESALDDTARARLSFELGNSYREAGQQQNAINAYVKAVTYNQTYVAAYEAESNLLVAMGRKDDARQVLTDALAKVPGNVDLQRDLSVLQLGGTGAE